AYANKKAGKNIPYIDEAKRNFHLFLGMEGMCFHSMQSITIDATKILTAPSCMGVKPKRPFFIKINELPQTIASTARMSHLDCFIQTVENLCKNHTFLVMSIDFCRIFV